MEAQTKRENNDKKRKMTKIEREKQKTKEVKKAET